MTPSSVTYCRLSCIVVINTSLSLLPKESSKRYAHSGKGESLYGLIALTNKGLEFARSQLHMGYDCFSNEDGVPKQEFFEQQVGIQSDFGENEEGQTDVVFESQGEAAFSDVRESHCVEEVIIIVNLFIVEVQHVIAEELVAN